MWDGSEKNENLKELMEYLGITPDSKAAYSSHYKEEEDILNSIMTAFRDKRKFFVEIVKSFDIENLNSVFIYIYNQLEKNGVKIELLKNLDLINAEKESDGKYLYLITEKYLDLSNKDTLHRVVSLIGGHLPRNLMGIPILIGLTENTLRFLDRYRAESADLSELYIDRDLKRISSQARLTGTGLILLSTTFLITLIGMVIDRPRIFPFNLSTATGIVFAASFLGIFGFVAIILGSINIPYSKVKVIGEILLLIAICEVTSIFLQLSNFSLWSSTNGLHLALSLPRNILLSSVNLDAGELIAVIYTMISIVLAVLFYFLVHSFSSNGFKKITKVALLSGVIAEIISLVVIFKGSYGLTMDYFIAVQAKYLYLSFYNNVSPVMPYPGISLDTADFLFTFSKYSIYFFYSLLVLGGMSNLLFFVSFLHAGSRSLNKAKNPNFSEGR